MIRIRQGKVVKVLTENPVMKEVLVAVEGGEARAVNYNLLTGPVAEGDVVVLNTTAVHKSLGTGGWHFVMANLSVRETDTEEAGHIMKLRYTPGQVKCLAVEEEESPYHEAINACTSIEGLPVIVSTLHSMLPLIAAGIRAESPKIRTAYIMTDGAALPIWFSKMVRNLTGKGWIAKTITIGHAFGGDLEAVNIYTGLAAAKVAAKADLVIVGMGPGIVGTGTRLGFTGVEQGEMINAVHVMEGLSVAVPRISFADPRARHRGVSHHSLTALGRIALARAKVVLPELETGKAALINEQLAESGITEKHDIVVEDGKPAVDLVKSEGIKVTTMGRDIDQDLEFFLTAGAAGIAGAKLI